LVLRTPCPFWEQPDASELEFLAIALDEEDEGDLSVISRNHPCGQRLRNIKGVADRRRRFTSSLHGLLREGGDEFVPYPLPEGELRRPLTAYWPATGRVAPEMQNKLKPTGDRNGVVIRCKAWPVAPVPRWP
jgi:pilus assembly protein CpaE